MRCERCHRPISTPTATVRTRGGPLNYGPTCARKGGLMPVRERAACIVATTHRAWADPRQLPLGLEMAA
jgi:hypothetical protein